MKKLLILVIGIVCMTVFLSGCKRDGPNLNNPRDEESYYEYGFMEEYPFLGIFLDCFNVYCTIDGIQYCGRCTLLNLE